ncbi:A disintegrin and metalloproteinase with thrombospondin motifs 9-like [Ostrinia furnacalis]|uniref:A disintegrin and metalloproteinase with thrombospondin motifs 9-like n=1 Tax=Ostrinia furnacalis TaxID=93504 RepID=UPI00103EA232|nr:A disintegrin and metalloproteinase with thrombospondin motifs 9-like [Ostrinia furnacalis]
MSSSDIHCHFLCFLQVVGREGVLASTATRELHCGRRLVSGLFSRPRLPLGYSYVTTVPRGACRLNVSEIVPSDNYIALKVTNGSYIMNGEFAVSAPGTYEAAGARFTYSRTAGLDNVFALGPIHHPIDIMILYTQPNPNIKYEFLTDSEPEESNDIPMSSQPAHHLPRHHRHHPETHKKDLDHSKSESSSSKHLDFSALESQSQIESNVIGDRKFVWKILSFTQCSRTCGGGLQIGKFKCVEVTGKEDKEVSSAYCTGAPPPTRRRRCGGAPCPPRWRAAAWGACPVCGPAQRTRIVGCVQDHARGITKISDQKCPLPMPPSSEPCDIPNCDGTPVAPAESPRLDTRRQVRPKDRTDAFHDGPVISLATNFTENDVTPAMSLNYNFNAAGGWLYTEWSECVGWCVGGGVQSRGVRCAEPGGCSTRAPVSTQTCSPRKQCDAQWFTSEWSACSAPCDGRQVRGVICIGGNGRRLRDGSCRTLKPETERACGGTCAPSWYLSDWSQCEGPCEAGVQTRTVWCAKGGEKGAGGAARDAECAGVRPAARRTCVPSRCSTKPVARPRVEPQPPSGKNLLRLSSSSKKQRCAHGMMCEGERERCEMRGRQACRSKNLRAFPLLYEARRQA